MTNRVIVKECTIIIGQIPKARNQGNGPTSDHLMTPNRARRTGS